MAVAGRKKSKEKKVSEKANLACAARLRSIRAEEQITQSEAADIIGIGQRAYSAYETGRCSISVENLGKLAEYFDVSMDYLSGASPIKKPFSGYPDEYKNGWKKTGRTSSARA